MDRIRFSRSTGFLAFLCFSLSFTACGGGDGPTGGVSASTTGSGGSQVATISTPSTATPRTSTASSSNAATLVWEPPLQSTDGSSLPPLAGYRVYHGTDETRLVPVADLDNPGLTSYVMERLATGMHYFAVTAYTSEGVESAWSNIEMKLVR